MEPKIHAILTGATGMVGEGILLECIANPAVESILVVGRKPCGVVHTKVRELIVKDFFDLSSVESELAGYNACFFCAGVTSLGKKEPEYTRVTYDLTMHFAGVLSKLNDGMTFCYVSGAGTDGTEKGRLMWARVKGKAENDLMKLPFKAVYNFRPAFMKPMEGQKNVLSGYNYVMWLYPVLRRISPAYFGTLKALGVAMINCALSGSNVSVLESSDIAKMAGE